MCFEGPSCWSHRRSVHAAATQENKKEKQGKKQLTRWEHKVKTREIALGPALRKPVGETPVVKSVDLPFAFGLRLCPEPV